MTVLTVEVAWQYVHRKAGAVSVLIIAILVFPFCSGPCLCPCFSLSFPSRSPDGVVMQPEMQLCEKKGSTIQVAGQGTHLQLDAWSVTHVCESVHTIFSRLSVQLVTVLGSQIIERTSVHHLDFQGVERRISSTEAAQFPQDLISPLGN